VADSGSCAVRTDRRRLPCTAPLEEEPVSLPLPLSGEARNLSVSRQRRQVDEEEV
jgi:hypothetical protein